MAKQALLRLVKERGLVLSEDDDWEEEEVEVTEKAPNSLNNTATSISLSAKQQQQNQPPTPALPPLPPTPMEQLRTLSLRVRKALPPSSPSRPAPPPPPANAQPDTILSLARSVLLESSTGLPADTTGAFLLSTSGVPRVSSIPTKHQLAVTSSTSTAPSTATARPASPRTKGATNQSVGPKGEVNWTPAKHAHPSFALESQMGLVRPSSSSSSRHPSISGPAPVISTGTPASSVRHANAHAHAPSFLSSRDAALDLKT